MVPKLSAYKARQNLGELTTIANLGTAKFLVDSAITNPKVVQLLLCLRNCAREKRFLVLGVKSGERRAKRFVLRSRCLVLGS